MSGGKPSEMGCYAAANAAYDYVLKRDDIDPKLIVTIGWSLGAASAIELADTRPVAGVVTVSAFTSLRDMAHQFIPWLPMSLIMRYRFDNLSKVAEISCPILIVHGTEDELVPLAMAGRLAAAAKGKATRYNVIGGGHNDVFKVGGIALLDQISKFLDGIVTSQVKATGAKATIRPAAE
jgi:hypothetical protein